MGQGELDWLLRDPRGRLKRLRLRVTVIPPRTALQKRQILKRPELSPSARELLQRTDSRLHPYEDMYTGDGFPYFWAGLEAIRNIENALDTAGVAAPDAILDMPCGFGRVTRRSRRTVSPSINHRMRHSSERGSLLHAPVRWRGSYLRSRPLRRSASTRP